MPDPGRARLLAGQVLVISGCAIAAFAAIGMVLAGWPIAGGELLAGLLGALVLCGIPVIAGAILIKRAGPAPANPAPVAAGDKPPLTALRMIFAVFAVLLMLFAGGCAMMFGVIGLASADNAERGIGIMIAIFAIAPLLAGALVWWLAVKRGR